MVDQLTEAGANNSFAPETKRLQELRRDLEKSDGQLEKQLTAILDNPRTATDRYAIRRAIGVSEQLNSTRVTRLGVIRALAQMKAMTRDGALKIAQTAANIDESSSSTAVNAALLQAIQGTARGGVMPGSEGATIDGDFTVVEGDADKLIESRLHGEDPLANDGVQKHEAAPAQPAEPGGFAEGNLVCDASGRVYIVNAAGEPEPYEIQGEAELHMDAEEPYAVLPGGLSVPLVEIT